MSRSISHFKLGLFFLISGAIILGGLFWVGATHLFQAQKTYVTFFDESIDGLAPGASVRYLGLKVGRVASVGLAPDGKLVRVVMDLEPKFKITKSMAIQLELKGITGQRFLAIVKAPPDIEQVTPAIHFPTQYPVIPARRGELTQITDALQKIYQRIKSADFEGLINSWKQTAQDVNAILTSTKVKETLANVKDTSAGLKKLTNPLNHPGNPEKWQQAFANLAATAKASRKASESLANQLQKLPPGAIAQLAQRMNRMVHTSQESVKSIQRQADQTLATLQQTLYQTDQTLASLRELITSLREEPGKILKRPKSSQPFER